MFLSSFIRFCSARRLRASAWRSIRASSSSGCATTVA
ncbi:hypothetical protein [Klebsiella phage Kpn74]|uniref:Uncharacterized protein n=1 Tax=Klebsiella phage Kpn74 TaxID=3044026 RepID=A0AAT9V583_9CAUD|nr:hypothetical protein [Klebsiella phage Kpn74]